MVGSFLEESFEGVPDGFNSSTTFDLGVDCVQNGGVKDHLGKNLVISPVLSRHTAIDITSISIIAGDCITDKVIFELLQFKDDNPSITVIYPIAAIYGEHAGLDAFITHNEEVGILE